MEKHRLQRKIEELEEQWNLLSEKLSRLSKEKILQTDVEEQFRLEHRIDDIKAEREQVEKELKDLDAKLLSGKEDVSPILTETEEKQKIVVEDESARENHQEADENVEDEEENIFNKIELDEIREIRDGSREILQRYSEWKNAEEWLIHNREVLEKRAANDVLKEPEKYRGRGLDSENEREMFKKSIHEHIQWILECFKKLTNSVPIEESLTTPINYLVRDAYCEVFKSISKQIREAKEHKQLHQEVADELLWFIEQLIEIYCIRRVFSKEKPLFIPDKITPLIFVNASTTDSPLVNEICQVLKKNGVTYTSFSQRETPLKNREMFERVPSQSMPSLHESQIWVQ